MQDADDRDPYWSVDHVALAASMGSGPGGLTSDGATGRAAVVGPNSVEDAAHLSALRLLLRHSSRARSSSSWRSPRRSRWSSSNGSTPGSSSPS
jgi:hypothetical protein